MRISNLDLKAYGLFADYPLADLAAGIVVVHGVNETGKTTLFSALTSLLYGFYPPSADFPYRPWHTDRHPELQAVILLKDGTTAEIMRRLTSSPQGTLTHAGQTTQIANRDLPFVHHVSRDLYKALYALTQTNARSLQESEQHEIEERLLGGMGANLLRPTRKVVAELKEEALQLWRPDRRGRPRCKGLQEQYRETRRRRDEAKERDEGIRGKAKRLHEVQQQLSELERSLAKLNAQIRRADVLLPVMKRTEQIENWRSEIPDLDVIEELPEGLMSENSRLSERVESAKTKVKDLERDRAALVEVQQKFSDEDSSILERSDRLQACVRRISAHEQERRNLVELRRKEQQLGNSVADAAQSLLAGPWKAEYATEIEKLVLPGLKGRIDQFQEKQTEAQRLEGLAENVSPVRVLGDLPRRLTAGAVVVGLLLLGVGLVGSMPPIWLAGIMVAVIGGVATVFSFYVRHERAVREDERENDIERLKRLEQKSREERDKAREHVVEILSNFPVAQAVLERPDLTLYQAVERLRFLSVQHRQMSEDLQTQQKEWDGEQQDLQELVEALGEQEATAEAVSRLEERLSTARKRRYDCETATERTQQIDLALEPAREDLSDAEEAYGKFTDRVAEAAGQSFEPKDALRRAADLQTLARRVRDAEQQLAADHPDLDQLKDEIRRLQSSEEETWALDAEEVELSRKNSQALNETWKTLIEEKINLSKDIDNAQSEVSVGELDGEIARIEEEIQDAYYKHDRLVLLVSILLEADRIFREKHQPDVLRRASEYLEKTTGGRYIMLTRMAKDDGEEQLSVKTKDGNYHPVGLPLSSGTLDQIYLAFRLAVIGHLDENYEPLPLFLDEALINWDDDRFDRGVEILREIAQQRQVFIFTCHDWVAERLRGLPGTSVHTLPAG